MIWPTVPLGDGGRTTRPGKELSLSIMNCAFGRVIALSMRSVHQVAVRLSPARPRGDHTPPAVVDFPVVGCRFGLPPVVDCTTTLSPPCRGSLTGNALLEKGAP